MRTLFALSLLFLLSATAPASAVAQASDPLASQGTGPDSTRDAPRVAPSDASRDVARVAQLGFENDLIAVRGAGVPPDHDYTSGIRLSTLHASVPARVRRLAGRGGAGRCDVAAERAAGCVAGMLGVMHQIYTPRENAKVPVPGERPYAGWLFGSADVTMVAPGHSRTFGIDAGVTGPVSMAEQVQNSLHRLLDNTPKMGWEDQLGNAAGVVLRYDEGRRMERPVRGAATALDVRWGARAGNMVNALSAAVEASLGFRGVLPWSPAEPRVERPREAFLSVGYMHELVLHNVLVEGRGAGPGAARRAHVGQLEAGLGYRHRWFSAAYRHIVRGREYDAQRGPHPFGSLTLSVNRF